MKKIFPIILLFICFSCKKNDDYVNNHSPAVVERINQDTLNKLRENPQFRELVELWSNDGKAKFTASLLQNAKNEQEASELKLESIRRRVFKLKKFSCRIEKTGSSLDLAQIFDYILHENRRKTKYDIGM